MSYASPSDVAVELGRPAASADETAQWQAWLDRVERSIERAFRKAGLVFADQVDLDDPTVADVVDVEVAAVIRRIDMPKPGRTSITRSIDDASTTERWEGEYYGLDLTADEWDSLLPGSDAQAFSTRPGFVPDAVPWDSWA